MDDIFGKHCQVCEGGVQPLTRSEAEERLKHVTEWSLNAEGTMIYRTLAFKNYYHTMAFVNALAYISHIENHHPDLEVFYNRCIVKYTTHAIRGLSENDFICAKKTDSLIEMKA